MFEPKQLAQSEIVQDLPKKGNQELVRKITRNQRDVQMIWGLIEWMITQSLYTLQEGQKTK